MNTQFVGEVGIGHPPQFFDAIFDTGSANFWINSKKCHDASCENHDAYDSSKSDKYKELGFSAEVQFGTGSIKGDMISDEVRWSPTFSLTANLKDGLAQSRRLTYFWTSICF